MRFAILDCFTDEPSGLGVPPYIGTYPRYIYGSIIKNGHEPFYLSIDDLRDYIKPKKERNFEKEIITDIHRYNFTNNHEKIEKIMNSCDFLLIISGVQTPGKYLCAMPGTVKEASTLISEYKLRNKEFSATTILCGPGAEIGEGLFGGTKSTSRKFDDSFDYVIKDFEYKFDEFSKNGKGKEFLINDYILEDKSKKYSLLTKSAVLGAGILSQLNNVERYICEIETMRGCKSKTQCSFCTEKLKNCGTENRPVEDIIDEMKAISHNGLRNFRLGKQTCFYSYGPDETVDTLLKNARKYSDILHIDNVNPHFVNENKTKSIVKYTTPGNIAAFGIETFDEKVGKLNYLNTNPEEAFSAIKLINKYGAERGDNGMPKFLPGINILFGLNGETKETHEKNMMWLKRIVDEGLMVRRINIREVVVFENTPLDRDCGIKYLKKNHKYYWKWRDEIRQNIDVPMLERIVPKGTILKDLVTEIYDGNTTFARQIGTYPLTVGIKGRLGLGRKINISVKDHMKRSIVGEEI